MNADTTEDDRRGETTENERETRCSRRTYVSGLFGTAAAGTLLTSLPTASAQSTTERFDRYYSRFDTVIDMVEAGGDPNGNESITPLLNEYCDDDTLLVFPPGEYYMDEQFRYTGFENFGLVGNDATIVAPSFHDIDGPNHRLFRLGIYYNPGNRLLFEGFTIDQTAPNTGIRVIEAGVDDGLEVRDITVEGTHDSGTWGPGRFNVFDPNGSGIVERFEAPDGGVWESETPNAGNLWRGPSGILSNMNEGTLTFRNCDLGPFPDNGLYAAHGPGRIVVEGGRYANSHGTNVRIGGHDCLVDDVSVVVDETPDHFSDQDGIRLQHGDDHRIKHTTVTSTGPSDNARAITMDNDVGDVELFGVDVTIDSPGHNTGIMVSEGVGHVRIYGCDIQHDGPAGSGGYAIMLNGDHRSGSAEAEHLRIKGDVGDDGGRCAIYNERDGVRFAYNTIYQPGGRKRSTIINTGRGCEIYKGAFRSSRYPIDERGTDTRILDIYAKSYNGDPAVCLRDTCENTYLKDCSIRGGIEDMGADSPQLVNNAT